MALHYSVLSMVAAAFEVVLESKRARFQVAIVESRKQL